MFHFATINEWNYLVLIFGDEILYLLQVIEFSEFFVTFWSCYEFSKKSEENLIISNTKMLEKSEKSIGFYFTIAMGQGVHNIEKYRYRERVFNNCHTYV